MPLLRHDAWTRVWVIPVGNPLGIVLVCLMVCPTVALGVAMPPDDGRSAPVRAAVLLIPGTLVLAGAIDWRWRFRQPNVGRVVRWLSPYEGATVVVFPIWVCSASLLFLKVVALARHFR